MAIARLPEESLHCTVKKGGDRPDEVACSACGLDPMCSLLDYGEEGSGVPDGILLRRRQVARGEAIFLKDEPFHSLFAIKSGSFKSLLPMGEQQDQVVGFHLTGELVGAEGMAQGIYQSSTRALEASQVCELHIDQLPEAGKSLEMVQERIIKLLGEEVAFSYELITTLIHQSADQRVAGFLLNISHRLEHRKMPCVEFRLGMSRSDIGSFLGLANETVSRILTKLNKSRIISLQHKRVHILDMESIRELAQI
ncbi:MAG: helix-turn-helix domain-containing protein [Gammaproteobacteria bacterium]|nr:helix-turn-helix domain-containing protein [Gammaproteobacteria bacterium]